MLISLAGITILNPWKSTTPPIYPNENEHTIPTQDLVYLSPWERVLILPVIGGVTPAAATMQGPWAPSPPLATSYNVWKMNINVLVLIDAQHHCCPTKRSVANSSFWQTDGGATVPFRNLISGLTIPHILLWLHVRESCVYMYSVFKTIYFTSVYYPLQFWSTRVCNFVSTCTTLRC